MSKTFHMNSATCTAKLVTNTPAIKNEINHSVFCLKLIDSLSTRVSK